MVRHPSIIPVKPNKANNCVNWILIDFSAPLDFCDPDQCLNGATCVNGASSFTCTCPTGFSGILCQIGNVLNI